MRRTFSSSALLLLASTAVASADEAPVPSEPAPPATQPSESRPADKGTLGIGIVVGEPTGITAKLYLKDDQAIQGAVGPSFFGGGIELHGEYVWHPWILQDRDSFVLPVYLGPGVRLIDYSAGRGEPTHAAIGLRAVGGLLFDFKNVPLDAFVEAALVPEYDFKAGNGFGLKFNAGAGVRYYF